MWTFKVEGGNRRISVLLGRTRQLSNSQSTTGLGCDNASTWRFAVAQHRPAIREPRLVVEPLIMHMDINVSLVPLHPKSRTYLSRSPLHSPESSLLTARPLIYGPCISSSPISNNIDAASCSFLSQRRYACSTDWHQHQLGLGPVKSNQNAYLSVKAELLELHTPISRVHTTTIPTSPAHPRHSGRLVGGQLDLHHSRSPKVVLALVALETRSEELVQRLRVLVDEFGELRILRGDLLEQWLDEGGVLLDHLDRAVSMNAIKSEAGLTSRSCCM